MALLQKHHLKMNDWQLTRNLQENDFVDYLKQGFCQDLRDRHTLSRDRNASFPNKIRRAVPLAAAQELIINLHKNTFGLRA